MARRNQFLQDIDQRPSFCFNKQEGSHFMQIINYIYLLKTQNTFKLTNLKFRKLITSIKSAHDIGQGKV